MGEEGGEVDEESWSSAGEVSWEGTLRCDRACCDYETTCKQELATHAASCSAPPPLVCSKCDFEASCEESLKRHVGVCQGDGRKVYECDVCLAKFARCGNMRRHRSRHTKRAGQAKPHPHTCPVCSRGFQRHIAMRAHFQNEHVARPDPLTRACPLCPFTAPSMDGLRSHFSTSHGIDLERGGSGEESRLVESSSPPMHFLTPHVEISTSETTLHHLPSSPPPQEGDGRRRSGGSDESQEDEGRRSGLLVERLSSPAHLPPAQQSSPSQFRSQGGSPSPRHPPEQRVPPEPHVSLIPIKREASSPLHHTPSSLIKVSPLKSLLSEEARPYRLSCQFCGISFPDRTLYFLHKGCHSTDSNPWKCNICGEQTSNLYDFNSHLLSKSHH